MPSKVVWIAEHLFLIKWEDNNLTPFIKKRFKHTVSANSSVDMELTIHSGFGSSFVDYQVNIAESDHTLSYERADYRIEIASDFTNALIHVHDELALKHALTNLYSSFMVHHCYGLLVHSSCVKETNQAHLFTGYSGAGKSTVAKLSYPRELLSDEASVVKISSQGITVFNSPFRSELESDGTEVSASLASIQLLRQATYNERSLMKKSEAIIELMDKVFYWKRNDNETKQIWFMLNKLVQQVPVYELYFQKNNTFWELIS